MSLSLAQGPAYFAALMQKVFGPFNDFFFHMDDVLVHHAGENDHLEHFKTDFSDEGLKLKLSKCAFCKRYLQYLGHLISGEGIYPLKEKLELSTPRDVTETRHIIGLAFYYKKLLQILVICLNPLQNVQRKTQLSTGIHVVNKA